MTVALRNRLYKSTPPVNFLILGLLVGFLIGTLVNLHLADQDYTDSRIRDNLLKVFNVSEHNESDHDRFYNNSLAQQLYEEVRILCWVLTGPQNHEKKAKHVKATWGKRCNILLFMSTEDDPSLPAIALPVVEDRDNLWGKTKEAFKYVHKHYLDQADWFFKADDDTYAIMENMRYMLHFHSPTEPIYFGFKFKTIVKQGYMSGGSGYVLSKEAVKRFVEKALPRSTICRESDIGAEDAEMGKCLEAVGVKAGDSRDREGRSSFLPLYPDSFLIPGSLKADSWFWTYTYYPMVEGMQCCSDNLISVHYVTPKNMYLMEYFIYHVRPFGIFFNSTLSVGSEFQNDTLTNNSSLANSSNQTTNERSWDDYNI